MKFNLNKDGSFSFEEDNKNTFDFEKEIVKNRFEHENFAYLYTYVIDSLHLCKLNEDRLNLYIKDLNKYYEIFKKCPLSLKETLYVFKNLSDNCSFYQDIDGYKSETIILISFLSLMCGAKNIEQISEFAYFNNPFLQVFIPNMPKPHYELSAYAIYTILQNIDLNFVLSTFSLLFSNNYESIKMDISLTDTIDTVLIGNNTKFKESFFYDDIDKNLRMLPRFNEYKDLRDDILSFCQKRRSDKNLSYMSKRKLSSYYYDNPHNALINLILYFKELIIN